VELTRKVNHIRPISMSDVANIEICPASIKTQKRRQNSNKKRN